jgi:cardiolipin synthase
MLRIDDRAFAAHVRSYVDGEVARSCPVTPELHRQRSGLWTRIKQAAVYFVVGVLDYRVTRTLNIDAED